MIEPPWLVVARREAWDGVHEIPGPANSARVLDYHAATTLRATQDSVPWCAAFVCWSLHEAGYLSTRSAAARSFLAWGFEIDTPAHGAVVVLSRGSNAPPASVRDAPGHVGFLVGRPRQDEVLVLGGNQDDAVNVRAYPLSRVIGFRWPFRDDRNAA